MRQAPGSAANAPPETSFEMETRGLDEIIITAPIEGWLSGLEAVPDPVFAGRILGDGIAIDPVGDRVVAPFDGTITSIQSTGHAVAVTSDDGVELLIHVGVDTVALAGRGFTPCVKAGDQVRRGDTLIRLDLDLIVVEAKAAITPVILTNADGFDIVRRASDGLVMTESEVLALLPRDADGVPVASSGGRAERTVRIGMAHGLHARPAARLGEAARKFDAQVSIAHGPASAPLTSPVGLLTLGVRHGDMVSLVATGREADAAIAAIAPLIEEGMGEADTAEPEPKAPRQPVEIRDGQLAGVAAAPGLALGQAQWLGKAEIPLTDEVGDPASERAALDAALSAVSERLEARRSQAATAERAILEAHLAMIRDPELLQRAYEAIAGGQNAGSSWRSVIRAQVDALRQTSDPRLRERADDLFDLERQVLARLAGLDDAPRADVSGAVVLAEDLLPSEVVDLARAGAAAFCVQHGGPTSHAAILAATMSVPMVVSIGAALSAVSEGMQVSVDGYCGTVEPDPDPARLAEIEAQIEADRVRLAAAREAGSRECTTSDGVRIEAFANCGSVEDATAAAQAGAEGCGLLRTEFLFLDRTAAPDVDEQARAYQEIADALAPHPVIVRLLDVGGDKPAPYLPFPPEENPALGLRGIRVSLANPQLLDDQLRAILKVTPAGRCRIMAPMIASLDELLAVRSALDRVRADVGYDSDVKLGIMVETPAAAITADLLAAHADFLSIGTNDLTQYALAIDRGNAALAAQVDGLHPAVLRLIDQTCQGAARHRTLVGVCGALAGDPLAVPILIGLRVTELSVAPGLVPILKANVMALDSAKCRALAQSALQCQSPAQVRALAREFRS
jgi:multiphosphoryl transfer protein